MWGFLSELDRRDVSEFIPQTPSKTAELQRNESIQNLVAENMYRERIDRLFDLHGPFFTQLLNANYTLDCVITLLKKVEISDPIAYEFLAMNPKRKPVAKKWPQRSPRPTPSRNFAKIF